MFSIAALLTQWVPTIIHAISAGKATLDTLQADFNAGTPTLTPDQKSAAWAAIIQHDEVKAAMHHAAAGEDLQGNPLPETVEQPPAVVQVGTQLRQMVPLVAGPFVGGVAVAAPTGTPQAPPVAWQSAPSSVDEEADVVEPQVNAGDVGDAPQPQPVGGQSAPIPRPNRTALRSAF